MASRSSHWQLLADLARPRRRVLAVLGIVLAAGAALPLAGPQLLRAFIDRARDGAPLQLLLTVAGAYVAVGVLAQLATVVTTYVATRLAWDATNSVREGAAAHALSLDLGFHGATTPGSLVERIDGDATAIAKFLTDFVLKVVSGALTMAGALLLVTREDWRVGLAMTVFVAAAMGVVVRLRDRAVPATADERAAYADVIGVVAEQLDGAEDVRALGAGPYALERHRRASAGHLDAMVRAERAGVRIWNTTTGAFALGGVLTLLAGWALQRQGAISLGTVFLLFSYTQVLRRPVEVIAEQLQQVQRAAAGAARMRGLFDERPGLRPAGDQRLPEVGPLAASFDGVEFAYPDDGRRVLSPTSLSVSPGEVVGLVGHTGSGKTTLARLALRLVDPTSGSVRLGGVDLRDVQPEQLRRRIAIVTQDVQLFAATVRENVTLFTDGYDDEVLRGLLRDLGLDSWLAGLPQGLDTLLGEHAGLSAGQAQLLAIGRAFLRNPGLVVLDEASSRVDPATAQLVERALDRLLAGRTALVIAHRLQAVQRADTVVVLEAGRIVEAGPRRSLTADSSSRFAGLLRLEAAADSGNSRSEVRT
jgi:ABC-type multidrug transport system fused ATPase/permease subunit